MRFIVPFGRDGAADRAARAFCRTLETGDGTRASKAGVRPQIENLPGAGGLLGVRRANQLVRAGEPVLLLGTPTTHVLLAARLGPAEAPHESLKPLALLGSAPNVLLVSPRLEIHSVPELIDAARHSTLTYASAGVGQTIHVCTALFCRQAGIHMVHKPYDGGSATAHRDLVDGRVHVYFDSVLACVERIARGEAIPLAVSSRQRSPLLPAVPTLIECGFPEHALDVWLGVFGTGVAGAAIPGDPVAASRLEAAVAESVPRWRLAYESIEG